MKFYTYFMYFCKSFLFIEILTFSLHLSEYNYVSLRLATDQKSLSFTPIESKKRNTLLGHTKGSSTCHIHLWRSAEAATFAKPTQPKSNASNVFTVCSTLLFSYCPVNNTSQSNTKIKRPYDYNWLILFCRQNLNKPDGPKVDVFDAVLLLISERDIGLGSIGKDEMIHNVLHHIVCNVGKAMQKRSSIKTLLKVFPLQVRQLHIVSK
jgi:hypothetical protein